MRGIIKFSTPLTPTLSLRERGLTKYVGCVPYACLLILKPFKYASGCAGSNTFPMIVCLV